ncbi:hypothetical protein [Halomicronema hongdechloris]|nr:hypothetical protein [Halomicronema hongdechloris]
MARTNKSPWIETPATTVGYVDHPLVKLLRWIDRGLLWLESCLQRLWRWWWVSIVENAKDSELSRFTVKGPVQEPESVEPRR